MFECFEEFWGTFFMNDLQPPYSDQEIRERILKIKNTMQNNADMILKYENAFADADLIVNNKKIESENLSPSEKKAFEIYEALKKSQSNLQAQLEQFEAYLSSRGVQIQSSGKGSFFARGK